MKLNDIANVAKLNAERVEIENKIDYMKDHEPNEIIVECEYSRFSICCKESLKTINTQIRIELERELISNTDKLNKLGVTTS